ncbi:MAG: hypothetical protein K5891_00895 [Lachnospiraceae bacterium]|nr:hypothetical protein [Lachnospiraceae bacterium]
MKKKTALLLLTCLVLLVPGCGGPREEPPSIDPGYVAPEKEESAAPEQEPGVVADPAGSGESQTPEDAGAAAEEPVPKAKYLFVGEIDEEHDFSDNIVRNNGTHFVQVNDTVIFRAYGPDALDSPALHGEFMSYGRQEPDYDYLQDSTLWSYQPDTDTLKMLCEDDGTGKLYYADGWIWSEGMDEDWNDLQVYRIDPATGRRENLSYGSLSTVTESGIGLIQKNGADENGDYRISYSLCDRTGKLMPLDFGDYKSPYFYAASGDYLIFLNQDYESEDYPILAVNARGIGDVVLLGTLKQDEDMFYAWPSIDQVVAEGDMLYLVIAYYGGSGGFWQGGFIAQADARNPGSMQKLVDDGSDPESDYAGASSIWLEDGKLQIGTKIPESATYSAYDGGILQADASGAYQKTGIELCGTYPEGSPVSEQVEEIAYLQGGYFAVVNRVLSDPSQSVGWRAAYHRLDTRYEYVRPDGTVKVLTEVERKAILPACVALDGSGSGLYFQPVHFSGDGEEDMEVYYSEDYFLAETAGTDVVADYESAMFDDQPVMFPLEKLKEFAALKVITDPEKDEYGDGYSVYAFGEESLSGQIFILHFNAEGKLTMIFPDYAG